MLASRLPRIAIFHWRRSVAASGSPSPGQCRVGRRLVLPVASPFPMPSINSVLGPLDVANLGFTPPHEHLFTASAGIFQTYPELFGDFAAFTQQLESTLRD